MSDDTIFIHRPSLFAAQGTGFTEHAANGDDEQVTPGTHVRCFADPAVGPMNLGGGGPRPIVTVTPLQDGVSIASINDLSAWEDGATYPVRKASALDPQGDDRLTESRFGAAGKAYHFERKAEAIFGSPHAMYIQQLLQARQDPLCNRLGQTVIGKLLRNRLADGEWLRSDACAVDVTPATSSHNGFFNALALHRTRVMTVKAYDWKGRLVAEDWAGRRFQWMVFLSFLFEWIVYWVLSALSFILFGLIPAPDPPTPEAPAPEPEADDGGSPAAGMQLVRKSRAVLRAPAIHKIVVTGDMEADDVWWVFTDDYLEDRQVPLPEGQGNPDLPPESNVGLFWMKSSEFIGLPLDPDNASCLTPDYVFGPFNGASLPDFARLQQRVTGPNSLGDVIASLESCGTIYEMHQQSASLAGTPGTDTEGMSSGITMMDALALAGTDPLVARLTGTYFFQPVVSGGGGQYAKAKGDFKVVLWYPACFSQASLAALGIWSPSGCVAKVHLTALVMGADTMTNKLLPEVDDSLPLNAAVNPLESNALMVSSKITLPEKEGLRIPYLQTLAYRVLRGLKIDAAADFNFTDVAAEDDGGAGAGIAGVLPPVLFPTKDPEGALCLRDFFRSDVADQAALKYALTPIDIFGRGGPSKETDPAVIQPPCYPPVPPTNAYAYGEVVQDGGNAARAVMHVTFYDPFVHPENVNPWRLEADHVQIVLFKKSDGGTWSDHGGTTGVFEGCVVDVDVKQGLPPGQDHILAWKRAQLQWNGDALDIVQMFDPPPGEPMPSWAIPPLEFDGQPIAAHDVSIPLGGAADFGWGMVEWCVHLRSAGRKDNGEIVFSTRTWVLGKLVIEEVPPDVTQPNFVTVPTSTYPDRNGDSYYVLDLSLFIANGKCVNVYLTRADMVWADIEDQAPQDILDGVRAAAVGNRKPFDLDNAQPIEVSDATKFYRVKVSGDIRKHFIAAVIGVAGSSGREAAWSGVAAAVFKTPQKTPIPNVEYVGAATNDANGNGREIEVRYKMDADRLYDANPPRLLVMKKHETLGGDVLFLSTVEGVLDLPETDTEGDAGTPAEDAGPPYVYRFLVKDAAVEPWHAYAYHVAPAVYVQAKGGYVRDLTPKVTRVACTGRREPTPIENVSVTNEAAQGLTVEATFKTGEFDWGFHIFHDNVQAESIQGAVVYGEVVNVTGADADAIEIDRQGASYVLTYRAAYVSGPAVSCSFRLRHGPYSWIARGEVQ